MGTTPRDRATILMMQRRVEQLLLEPVDDFFSTTARPA